MEKVKITIKLLKILRAYTKLYTRIETKYYKRIGKLEKQMQKETGIKDIEFYCCNCGFYGIGTPSKPEKMDLIRRNRLEK